MMRGDRVWCHICEHEWDSLDPGVHYFIIDGTWECVEEPACLERRAVAALAEGRG